MIENPKHGDKWLCEKCHTWCTQEVPKCSWCGTKRPERKSTPKPEQKKDV